SEVEPHATASAATADITMTDRVESRMPGELIWRALFLHTCRAVSTRSFAFIAREDLTRSWILHGPVWRKSQSEAAGEATDGAVAEGRVEAASLAPFVSIDVRGAASLVGAIAAATAGAESGAAAEAAPEAASES
ncbi:MAG: hypothetical protein JWO86_609, partial [Myxococcaceae bacterium]|nr:hypothetical protein [Myxococcaceae bacterium]